MQQFQELLFLCSLKCSNELTKYWVSAMHELNLMLNWATVI